MKKQNLFLALLAFWFISCGSKDETTYTTPTPASGQALVYGVLQMAGSACPSEGLVLVTATYVSNGIIAYQNNFAISSRYDLNLSPGTYSLLFQAPPCSYAEHITVTSGQTLIIHPILN